MFKTRIIFCGKLKGKIIFNYYCIKNYQTTINVFDEHSNLLTQYFFIA